MNILKFDIETMGYIFMAFNTGYGINLTQEQILRDASIFCLCYQINDGPVKSMSVLDYPKNFKKNMRDDSLLVRDFSKILEKADLVVYHNGKRFDEPWIMSRLLKYKFPDVRGNYLQLDTRNEYRKHFKLASYKLDYIASWLGYGHKLPTSFDWWMELAKADLEGRPDKAVKRIKEFIKYNKMDVILLDKIYKHLLPYMETAQSLVNAENQCPHCRSRQWIKHGLRRTNSQIFQRYLCKICGAVVRGSQGLIKGKDKILK